MNWDWMKDQGHWILDTDGQPQPCDSFCEWMEWFETADRRIETDYLQSERYGVITVSTVFLGLAHPPNGELFETMIFREKGTDKYRMPPRDDILIEGLWGELTRYMTRAKAEAGHRQIFGQLLDSGLTSPGKDDRA